MCRSSRVLVGLVVLAAAAPAAAQVELRGTYVDYVGMRANGVMLNESGHSMRYRETTADSWSSDAFNPGSPYYYVRLEATDGSNFVVENSHSYSSRSDFVTVSGPTISGRSALWSGRYSSGSRSILLALEYALETDGRHVLVTATITNEGTAALTDLYLMFVDEPDIGADIGGDYATYNDVRRQPPAASSALKTNRITAPWAICLGAGTVDERARVSSTVDSDSADPSETWAAPTDDDDLLGDYWSAIVFREASLAAGASTEMVWAYVWGPDLATVEARFDAIDFGRDSDGDGWTRAEGDCDDADPRVHPGATETCDGIDEDCDGTIDEGHALSTFYRDADGDGWGAAGTTALACAAPPGHVATSGDCDDADPRVHPGATEVCDGADNDCDGETDEGLSVTYYADGDGDGYGNPPSERVGCEVPDGYVEVGGDCNDADRTVNPGAAELCDGVDNDCDGQVDEGFVLLHYEDADGDGYGDPDAPVEGCDPPEGAVAEAGDCDDTDPDVHPGAPEVEDGLDNDCDGQVDEAEADGDVDSDVDSDVDADSDVDSDADADGGDTPRVTPPGACRCTAGADRPGAAAWLALALVALARRRLRSRRG